jgi:WD40-like Beta Propeller Repeat
MHDDVTFEARLADAFGRYAELAPFMDDDAVARDAIAAGGSRRGLGRLLSLRPAPRIAYLLIVLALVLAAILVVVAGGAFRTAPSPPIGRNGTIVFTLQGNDHGPAGTHVMQADGTGDRAIAAERCPTYSSDGRVLAAMAYDGSASLVIRDADGNLARRLALVDDATIEVSYALSPDGTHVAWFKPVGTGDELWVAPVSGDPGIRIVPPTAVPGESRASPTWSPDGDSIAFATYVADPATGERRRSAIDVVGADGSDVRRLTTRPGLLGDGLSWSPDGRYLAYAGLPDAQPVPSSSGDGAPIESPARDVFVIGADGEGDLAVTNTAGSETQPAWSPDGTALAFETSTEGEAHRLTTVRMNGPTPAGRPILGPESAWFVWSPDATSLLWPEVTTVGPESFRTTIHAIDRDLRQAGLTLQSLDGEVVCPPSWQRLEP